MKVELKNICKAFGPLRANDDVSLCVEAGTIHGLLGENGAGKSTLMKVLTGFITADSGQILLDNCRCRSVRRSKPSSVAWVCCTRTRWIFRR